MTLPRTPRLPGWLLALVLLLPAVVGSAPASAEDGRCGDVTVVFARGSGQRLAQRESAVFFAGLSVRLGSAVRATAYELGAATHGGARYPAVGVVGDALPALPRRLRDRIVFVALFGDPKLSLPEGRGVFPVACRGRSLSPWRRGNASCYTDNGVLDARSPYVPPELARRVGSWCDRDDPICTSNLGDFARSTHGTYAKPGRGVDQAVREAAAAVRDALGERGEGIDVTVGAVDHVYPATFEGRARLRVAAADGAELMTSVAVHVDRSEQLTRRLPAGHTAATLRAAYGADGAVGRWRAPDGTGSSRFAAVVPARHVTGPRKGNPDRRVEQVRAGPAEHLTTAPLVIAVALLLATTGAHWIWLFRAPPTARGRHRRR